MTVIKLCGLRYQRQAQSRSISTGRHVISARCELCVLSPLGRMSRGSGEADKLESLPSSTRRARKAGLSEAKPGDSKLILIEAPEIRSPNLYTPVSRSSHDPKMGLDVYPRFPGPPEGILALIRRTDNQRIGCWRSRIAMNLWEGSRIRSVALPPFLIGHVPLFVFLLPPFYVMRLHELSPSWIRIRLKQPRTSLRI